MTKTLLNVIPGDNSMALWGDNTCFHLGSNIANLYNRCIVLVLKAG